MEPLPTINKLIVEVMVEVEEDTMVNKGGRGRGNVNNSTRVCTYCGKKGHIVDICYKKHGYPPNWGYGRDNQGNGGNAYANNVGADNEGVNGGNVQPVDEGHVSLTKDQYNSLLDLLERNTMDDIKHSTNTVKGETSHCYSTGVAEFNVNLIFVSRLAKGNNCVLSFENDSCIIQAKDTMRGIGLAKQLDGLYYLKPRQVSANASQPAPAYASALAILS
ncbi:hypothetical protein L195_g013469 [Trifolium pratense]|uniref:CCHC-type domain-containing protein n=1 Tax=Trifolium pratense TaxID=57577 RepID=A0A2K3P590_TRIPR|nr:hypothetical protein L195_g007010 [Trifolium pratense]PNY16744.1 hypothetical protein L195_g013469 [Trifolium pratense]